MGIFGQRAPLPISTPFATPESMETGVATARGRGVFGRGSFGRDLVGALADRLAINGGMAPAYAQSLAQERELQKYKMQQADELAQYERKRQIDQRYPTQQPYRWESNDGSLMGIGPDGQPQVIYKDPSPKMNWVRADNGDGTFTMVPVPMSGGSAQGQDGPIPTKPFGKLTPYNGGQTFNPSGSF